MIHQKHDYAHVKGARGYRWVGPEGDANKALLRLGQSLSLHDATHRLFPTDWLIDRGGSEAAPENGTLPLLVDDPPLPRPQVGSTN